MRPFQIATAAIIVLIAAVVMYETRGGALPDTSSGAPGGLKGGWWPFWSAAVVALAGTWIVVRSMVQAGTAEGAFAGRKGLLDLLRLLIPMTVVVLLMPDGRLGFYLASGLYVLFFAAVTARYAIHWSLLGAVTVPAAIFLIFEIAFRATLPKSFLYPGMPF